MHTVASTPQSRAVAAKPVSLKVNGLILKGTTIQIKSSGIYLDGKKVKGIVPRPEPSLARGILPAPVIEGYLNVDGSQVDVKVHAVGKKRKRYGPLIEEIPSDDEARPKKRQSSAARNLPTVGQPIDLRRIQGGASGRTFIAENRGTITGGFVGQYISFQ